MAKHQEQKRKKDLGIFYTPPEVVGFIFDILNIWKEKEEKETGRWESKKHYPSVIDPACGEGIFLKKSISSGFTKVPYIFGADIDIKAFERWPGISLSSEFRKSKAKMRNFFFHQDGLSILKPPSQKYHYRGVKKNDLTQFDAVIGNPPYGGIGIKHIEMISELFWEKKKNNLKTKKQVITNLFGENKEIEIIQNDEDEISIPQITEQQAEELKRLCQNLLNLDIWQNIKKNRGKLINHCKKINGVDFYINEVPDLDEVKRLKSFPIEILFVNRFIQLAKPGGWIAIIIPDGILTNSNSHYVREFIADKTKIKAIVSLPRETFKQAGTGAKTSILLLRKLKENKKPSQNYPVFLASVEKNHKDYFQKIAEFYQKLYNTRGETMNKINLTQITKDQTGKEVVIVRADKTLKEITLACQTDIVKWGRWDVKYWLPKYEKNIDEIQGSPWPQKRFYEILSMDDVIQGSKGVSQYTKTGIQYLTIENIVFTGFDFSFKPKFVKPDGSMDVFGSRPKYGYVVLVRTGATIGKVVIVTDTEPKYTVTSVAYKLKFKQEINPFYVCIFLKSSFGQLQLHRLKNGTGIENLNLDSEVPFILIPIIDAEIQTHIESEYKKMSAFHDNAMEAKKNNNEVEYKKNIEIAEKMLKDLILKTEAVIRGERDDVV